MARHYGLIDFLLLSLVRLEKKHYLCRCKCKYISLIYKKQTKIKWLKS